MVNSKRKAPNVGVGTLTDANDELEAKSINAGWDMFQNIPYDDSVMKSMDFSEIPMQQSSEFGPHIFQIQPIPHAYLDPQSLYLTGKLKVVHYAANSNEISAELPKNDSKLDHVPCSKQYHLTSKNLFNALDVCVHMAVDLHPKKFNLKDKGKIGNDDSHHKYELDGASEFEKCDITFYPGNRIDDTKIEKRADIGPCNLFPQACFRDVVVKMNGKVFSQTVNAQYGYKSYLETLLTYSPDATKTHLISEMFIPTNYIDNDILPECPETSNRAQYGEQSYTHQEAWHRRRQLACADKEFAFSMQLHTEFTSIDRFMPDDIKYQFEFVRADPKFALIGETPGEGQIYRVQMTDLKLNGRWMMPAPKLHNKLQAALNHQAASFITTRSNLLTSIMNKDVTSHQFTNIFSNDILPEQIYMFMVSSEAYQGAYKRDPFIFHDYDVSLVRLQINNENLPINNFEPDFKRSKTTNEYFGLYDNLGIGKKNVGLNITKEMFDNGYTIFAWDLNFDKCAGEHPNHKDRHGNANMFLQFKKPLPEQVQLVIVGVYKDTLIIDNSRMPVLHTDNGTSLRAL